MLEYIAKIIEKNSKTLFSSLLCNILKDDGLREEVIYNSLTDSFEIAMPKLLAKCPNIEWTLTSEGFGFWPKAIEGTNLYIKIYPEKLSLYLK